MTKKKKQIVVLGLGQFGYELARTLAKSCEVLALDSNIDTVDRISNEVQRSLRIDARDFNDLSSVVSADFDEAIITMTEEMEASILCTLYMKRIGVPIIRAKANGEDHEQILKAVGATEVIFPERETAHRLAARVLNPNMLDYLPLHESVIVMELAAPKTFAGHTLLDLNLRKDYGAFAMAVKRAHSEHFVFLPGADYVVHPDDVLVLIGVEQDMSALQDLK
jgi:trk system potassium uptake protein TrkA